MASAFKKRMSGFVNKVKEKTGSSSSKSTSEGEQQFTIQPHPAVRFPIPFSLSNINLDACSEIQ